MELLPPIFEAPKGSAGASILANSTLPPSSIESGCIVALHMHQPLVLSDQQPIESATVVGNLERMLASDSSQDSYNAGIFLECYRRPVRLIQEALTSGAAPRLLLEYSGTLFHGLELMGRSDVLTELAQLADDPQLAACVEWLGCTWGHAVAPSTPLVDYRKHLAAWRHHFAHIFGAAALARVRGFSLAEMALPNEPEQAYGLVQALNDFGYEWTLVQEDTIEAESGELGSRHLPHLLVCKNAAGQEAGIVCLIKTQGSDTKLVGQMQPYYEALGLRKLELAGRAVAPAVVQIADGENGGVMMNEFPGKFRQVCDEARASKTRLLTGSEYLDYLWRAGVEKCNLPRVRPKGQGRLWQALKPGASQAELRAQIAKAKAEDSSFDLSGSSWTAHISWERGYEEVLGPMGELSRDFNRCFPREEPDNEFYCRALYYLLLSQTSCFRYWGKGLWTDYALEFCRRGRAALQAAQNARNSGEVR